MDIRFPNIRPEAVATAIPLTAVNAVALYGQYRYLHDGQGITPPLAVIIAGALESIALYLAYMAHKALTFGDTSLRLRLGAYGFGFIAGYMNYTHYSVHGKPSFLSVVTALMSVSSPFLWGVYSRRRSRDELIKRGVIEPGAIRLGANRWLWHPRLSLRVYRDAAWTGERDIRAAIGNTITVTPETTVTEDVTPVTPERDSERDKPGPASVTATALSKAEAVTAAIAELGESVTAPEIVTHAAGRGVSVTAANVRQIRRRAAQSAVASRRASVRALPAGADRPADDSSASSGDSSGPAMLTSADSGTAGIPAQAGNGRATG